MNRLCRLILHMLIPAVLALTAVAPPAQAYASVSVAVNFFREDLAPYGRWVYVSHYGQCWSPYVRTGWRPYLDGRWVLTDYGWTWVADEEWGWAPFHYGRWSFDPVYSWVWVPDAEWGPAWVSWRYGDGYVGWAPLPPRVRWVAGVGLDFGGVDLDAVILPRAYTFVPERQFVDVPVRRYALPVARNTTLVSLTQDSTRYRASAGLVVNQGVPVSAVERVIHRPVPRLRVVDHAGDRPARDRMHGREVALFRPAVTREGAARKQAAAAPAARPRPTDVRARRAEDKRERRLVQRDEMEKQQRPAAQRAHAQNQRERLVEQQRLQERQLRAAREQSRAQQRAVMAPRETAARHDVERRRADALHQAVAHQAEVRREAEARRQASAAREQARVARQQTQAEQKRARDAREQAVRAERERALAGQRERARMEREQARMAHEQAQAAHGRAEARREARTLEQVPARERARNREQPVAARQPQEARGPGKAKRPAGSEPRGKPGQEH